MTKKPFSDFAVYVLEDLFGGMPGVHLHRMFGGYGLYRGEVMFGIIAADVLFFKTDGSNRNKYEARGSRPLTYVSRGKTVELSYWEVPADILEDRDALHAWAKVSYEINAALPVASVKKRKRGR